MPERFLNAVLVHVVKNTIASLNPALILAIQGAPGEGKSFQAREALARIGAFVVPLAGAAISGPHEGDAANTLIAAYRFASALRVNERRLVVLLIDDFDMSVAATHDGRTYTVNSQLVTGTLMSLADDPSQYATDLARIPIVLTGNNFTNLHAPLVRHGRMTFFEWAPTEKERAQIIGTMLASFLSSRELAGIGRFVESVRDDSLSFVSAVKDDFVDATIVQHAQRGAIAFDRLEAEVRRALSECRVEDLMRLAYDRRINAQSTDFTQKKRSMWGFK